MEALSPLYVDVLSSESERPTREQMLAVRFALEFPSASFLEPLQQLLTLVVREPSQSFRLVGYEEHEFPGRGVSEPEKLARTTLRRVRAASLHRNMSEEERAILESLRGGISSPPRKPIYIDASGASTGRRQKL